MIFRGFRVFEYALWQKTKTGKRRKSTESFLNQKIHIANRLILIKKQTDINQCLTDPANRCLTDI